MEAVLPRLDGVEVTRRLRQTGSDVRIVIFAISADVELQLRALRHGAGGFPAKEIGVQAVPQALEAVARGEAAIPRAPTMHLIEPLGGFRGRHRHAGRSAATSPRASREVLDRLAHGGSYRATSPRRCT